MNEDPAVNDNPTDLAPGDHADGPNNNADRPDNNADASRLRLPGHERRAQLLRVALEVFSDKGYHATTMIDIAEAAGVTKPVLYQHFDSKRELYGTLLSDLGHRLRSAVVESAAAAASPREQAEKGIRGYLQFVETERTAFRILFDGANRRDAEWSSVIRGVEQSLASSIAVLIDVPTIDQHRRKVLAYGVMGLVESMSRSSWADRDQYDREQLADDVTALIWSGLRGLGEPRPAV